MPTPISAITTLSAPGALKPPSFDAGKPGAFLSSYARTLTNQQLRFHTDRCDVVGLFCIRQALRGI